MIEWSYHAIRFPKDRRICPLYRQRWTGYLFLLHHISSDNDDDDDDESCQKSSWSASENTGHIRRKRAVVSPFDASRNGEFMRSSLFSQRMAIVERSSSFSFPIITCARWCHEATGLKKHNHTRKDVTFRLLIQKSDYHDAQYCIALLVHDLSAFLSLRNSSFLRQTTEASDGLAISFALPSLSCHHHDHHHLHPFESLVRSRLTTSITLSHNLTRALLLLSPIFLPLLSVVMNSQWLAMGTEEEMVKERETTERDDGDSPTKTTIEIVDNDDHTLHTQRKDEISGKRKRSLLLNVVVMTFEFSLLHRHEERISTLLKEF